MFFSCSDNEPIENQGSAKSSVALRTTLAEYKKANGISSRSLNDESFCFEFVYPITFSYNTGTSVTVTSFEGLLDILVNESANFYLDGVVFPFQVNQQANGTVNTTTIETEGEFMALLQSCGFDTIDEDLQNSFCFDVVFPISISSTDGTDIISSMEEFEAYMNTSGQFQGEIVFPISVLYNGQISVITNIYGLYDVIGNCDSCICTAEYAPVCVQTPVGVVEYGNQCFALCAGFTQADFVTCNSSNECSISNLLVQTEDCAVSGSYDLTLNFTYSNPSSTQFEIRNSSNMVISTHNLADLPITITDYPIIGTVADNISVNFVGDTTCSATQQWTVPVNCGQNIFTENLGTCFTVNYPVAVQQQGAVITVINDTQLLLYATANGGLPAFNYPISVNFNGSTTTTISSSTQFLTLIDANCN